MLRSLRVVVLAVTLATGLAAAAARAEELATFHRLRAKELEGK
jgi:hypothetical protein